MFFFKLLGELSLIFLVSVVAYDYHSPEKKDILWGERQILWNAKFSI